MKGKSRSIERIQKNLILSIFIALFFALTTTIVIAEYYQYREILAFDKQLVEDEKKLFLKIAVDNVISYLNYISESSDDKMHEKLKDAVCNAYSQANNIYQKKKNESSHAELKALIIEALREVRYFNGRGYIYIIDMNGVLQMHPFQSHLEGQDLRGITNDLGVKFIQKQVELMQQQKEAFYQYHWPKSWKNDSVFYSKTAYLKRFDALNCYIGCGEYIDDHQRETQKVALDWLRNSYSAADWNLFINQYDGTSVIINSDKYQAGVNIKDISDNNGLKIFELELEIAQSGKADYLYYNWPISNDQFVSKVAYIKGFDDWNWMIGASSSLQQFDEIELQKTQSFYQTSGKRIALVLLLVIPLFIYVFRELKRNSTRLSQNFSLFMRQFENALKNNQSIKTRHFAISELEQLSDSVNDMLQAHFANVNALGQSEEKFRVLVESAPLVIVGVDCKGIIRLWNKQSEHFFKLKQEQVLNKPAPLSLVFAKGQSEEIQDKIWNERRSFELSSLKLKNGEEFFLYWASFKVSEELLIWVGNDVTALKKVENELEKNQRFLNNLLESIPSPVFYKDVKGKYLGGNQTFFQLIEKAPEEIIGKGVFELFSKDLAEVYHQKDLEVFEGHYQKYDSVYGKTPETLRHFTFYKAPFKNSKGEVEGLIGVMLDISERVKIEEQLTINQHELEKLNATKDKFFSIIAHDLINPFNTMLSAGELLTENLMANNIAEAKKMAKFMNPAIQRGYDLLLNLLDWSRTQTESIKFAPQKLRIGDELSKMIQLAEDMAALKNIQLIEQFEFNETATFDPNMLQTIVRNLISNAIKFTEDEGQIIIKTTLQSDGIALSISDNGVGMDEQTRSQLFNLGKTESTWGTKGEPGTGLGLVLVHEFVKQHKGEIVVESELGKGTTITILLPHKKDAPETDSA